jgi:predicted MFS family arabinose efflux permease
MGYLTTMQAAIAKDTPVHARGRVFGLANTAMQVGQGGAVAVGGVLASALSLQAALAAVGAAGAACAALVALTGRRVGEPERAA